MSTVTKLTEVFSAIGSDIKDLKASNINVDYSRNDIDATHTFNAYHFTPSDTWKSYRYSLATGQADGIATGSGAIPADLKVLTYA